MARFIICDRRVARNTHSHSIEPTLAPPTWTHHPAEHLAEIGRQTRAAPNWATYVRA